MSVLAHWIWHGSTDPDTCAQCLEHGYKKLAAQQDTDEERALSADRRARRNRGAER